MRSKDDVEETKMSILDYRDAVLLSHWPLVSIESPSSPLLARRPSPSKPVTASALAVTAQPFSEDASNSSFCTPRTQPPRPHSPVYDTETERGKGQFLRRKNSISRSLRERRSEKGWKCNKENAQKGLSESGVLST